MANAMITVNAWTEGGTLKVLLSSDLLLVHCILHVKRLVRLYLTYLNNCG